MMHGHMNIKFSESSILRSMRWYYVSFILTNFATFARKMLNTRTHYDFKPLSFPLLGVNFLHC